jgi:6-phosphogluconolactonase
MTPQLLIAPSMQAWIDESVQIITQASNQVISQRGKFSMVLSGGSTPRSIYQALADPQNASQIDWPFTYIFWGDERSVPPDHADSNYLMAKQALLDHVPVPPENIYRIRGELSPQDSAADHEERIKSFFKDQERRFDLVLLGLGADGHTASLFPESQALNENQNWVAPNYAPSQQAWRITLTYPALLSARQAIFLVSGAGKAKVVKQIIQDPYSSTQFPAAKVAANHPNLSWILDQGAAKHL